MTVEFFIGQEPDTQHERAAVEKFRRGMEAAFGNSKDYYFVLVNYFVGGRQVDLTVLKRDAIIVVELKECQESFVATENGDWQTPSGRPIRTGTRNPFEQVWDYRMQWVNFLQRHEYMLSPASLSGVRFDQAINTLVCISPKLAPGCRNEISKLRWFGLVGLDQLVQTVRQLSNPELSFSETDLRKLISKLNPRPGFVFTVLPPKCRGLVDRESECSQLMAFLGDNKIAVISLRGPGGVGKTELAAWLVDQAFDQGYQVKWVDYGRKQITLEALLAALAGEMPKEQADYIRNPKERLPDRLNAVLGYLDSRATLFVFDDYRLIADPGPIEEFLTYIVRYARKLRVVLTTRTRPTCFAHPDWSWQAAREICLEGLPSKVAEEFVGPEVASRLTADQLYSIWKEADGVPYLMKILTKVEFTPGRDEHLNQWLQSLLRTVSDEARHLAYGLSVIRGRLNSSLMQALARTDEQKTSELVRELTEQHILREWDEGGAFALYDLARDFLYAQASNKVKRDAHSDAGSHFAKVAETAQEKPERLKYLIEAVYHFEQADNPDKVLQLVGEAHALSRACGYLDEAQQFAEKALAAARKTQKRDKTCFWLAQIAEGEIDRDTLDVAGTHLKEAEASLPKLGKQPSPEQVAERNGLKMRISIQRGRLAYRTQDYGSASTYFNQALDAARALNDQPAIADCLIRIGQIERRHGHYAVAQDCFAQACDIAHHLGNQELAFESLNYMGVIARRQGNIPEAARLHQSAYQIALTMKDRLKEEVGLSYLGRSMAHPDVGQFAHAAKCLFGALAIAREIHNTRGIRIELTRLIDVLLLLQQYEKAEHLLQESEQRDQDANDQIGIAWNLKHRGQLEQRTNVERGNELIRQGIQKLEEIGIANEEWRPEFEAALK